MPVGINEIVPRESDFFAHAYRNPTEFKIGSVDFYSYGRVFRPPALKLRPFPGNLFHKKLLAPEIKN
jgi:hypothetical protein